MPNINKSRLRAAKIHKPAQPDPTEEEIWGPGGLAEQERMKRDDPTERNTVPARLIVHKLVLPKQGPKS